MSIQFAPMTEEYGREVIDIFNYYVENSFAAYPEQKMPYEFYGKLLELTKGYPAKVIKNGVSGKVIGFCFLRPYNPFPAFKETAEISYFIDKDEVGRGVGRQALALLETEGQALGIKNILASISSLNQQSLSFHCKNGFVECGRFAQVGRKKGTSFDVVWMQKTIR